MKRLVRWAAAAAVVANMAGCCVSPYRMWQNSRGWNNPVPDCYAAPGPPPQKPTPPGPKMPAAVSQIALKKEPS
jgi:hypothetical protein